MAPLKPFVVAERSMEPALRPGDGLLAVRSHRARVGEIRCFQHPRRPGFWLVKRVGSVDGSRFEARSDNDDPTIGAVDSRRFGPVPVEGSYRMVLRVPADRLSPARRGGGWPTATAIATAMALGVAAWMTYRDPHRRPRH